MVSIVRFELAFLGPLEQLTQLLLLCRLQGQVAKSQKRIIGKRFDDGISDGLADPVQNHIFQRAVRRIRKGPSLSGQLVGKLESQDFTHGSSRLYLQPLSILPDSMGRAEENSCERLAWEFVSFLTPDLDIFKR